MYQKETNVFCIQSHTFLLSVRMEKDRPCKHQPSKVGLAICKIKVDFKARSMTGDKEGCLTDKKFSL